MVDIGMIHSVLELESVTEQLDERSVVEASSSLTVYARFSEVLSADQMILMWVVRGAILTDVRAGVLAMMVVSVESALVVPMEAEAAELYAMTLAMTVVPSAIPVAVRNVALLKVHVVDPEVSVRQAVLLAA